MISTILTDLSNIYTRLDTHPIYKKLDSLENIILFMEHHIYSVWDFMNLLKTLQIHFSCTSIPWKPHSNPALSRLVNEIVLEEESDMIDGKATSHFMYYANALNHLNG